jgi:hypothetical protein
MAVAASVAHEVCPLTHSMRSVNENGDESGLRGESLQSFTAIVAAIVHRKDGKTGEKALRTLTRYKH